MSEKREHQVLPPEKAQAFWHSMWFCEGRSRDANHCFRLACVASKSSGHRHTVQVAPVLGRLHTPHLHPPLPSKEQQHTAGTPQLQECGQALGFSHLAFCPGAWVTCRLLTCHSTTWKVQGLGNSFNSLLTTWKADLQALARLWQSTAKSTGGEKHHSLFV